MEIGGESELRARPEAVWRALHDATLLKACVPGCERLEWLDEATLEAVLVLRIAGLQRRYSSRVHIRDAVPVESYTLLFGSRAETASVTSRVRLAREGGGTRIAYEVEARLDNTLVRLGAGAIEKIARKMAARFFERLDASLSENKKGE